MRLFTSLVSVLLALVALPAALTYDPLVASNMTSLENRIMAWNTAMDAYLQGDLSHTETALKVSAQLSLSINMTATSLVEAKYWDDVDSKKIIDLYGTLGGSVTMITGKLQEKMNAFIEASVSGFLDTALPPIKSASDGFAETLTDKTSASYAEQIKQVTVSIDTSLEGVLSSVHARSTTPAHGHPANGASSVTMSGSGDAQMSSSAKSTSHASASIYPSKNERRADAENDAFTRRADAWKRGGAPSVGFNRQGRGNIDPPELHRRTHRKRSGVEDQRYARRAAPLDKVLPRPPNDPFNQGRAYIRRTGGVESTAARGDVPKLGPPPSETDHGELDSRSEARPQERRLDAEDTVYARGGPLPPLIHDRDPELGGGPGSTSNVGEYQKRSDTDSLVHSRRAESAKTEAGDADDGPPKPTDPDEPEEPRRRDNDKEQEQKRSEAQSSVYVRRED